MSQPTPTPTPPQPSFDQVVKGNVDIKQLSKKKYKITFSKISKFLLYQVWSASSETLNEERSVYYQKANKWIKFFNSLNTSLKASNKPLFTPTTVMEIGDNKYVFIIDKAKLRKDHKNHVVFTVSTKGIESSEKKLLKLPFGHHDGVRFDIDYSTSWLCNNFPIFPSCPCVRDNTLRLYLTPNPTNTSTIPTTNFFSENTDYSTSQYPYYVLTSLFDFTNGGVLQLTPQDISDLQSVTQINIYYNNLTPAVCAVSFAYTSSNYIIFSITKSLFTDLISLSGIEGWEDANVYSSQSVYTNSSNPVLEYVMLTFNGYLSWCPGKN